MKKIKLGLQVVLSVTAILLLNYLNGTMFELPEFLSGILDVAIVFVKVGAVFALFKFMDIIFSLFDSQDKPSHDENGRLSNEESN
jgi:hypothetical protein